jgi:hypothetical protein
VEETLWPFTELKKMRDRINVGVQFIEPFFGLDNSSPYSGKHNISQKEGFRKPAHSKDLRIL